MKYINIILPNKNNIIEVTKDFTNEQYKNLISRILANEVEVESCTINSQDVLNIIGFGVDNPNIIGNDKLDIIDDMFGWRPYLDFDLNYYYVNKHWDIIEEFINKI